MFKGEILETSVCVSLILTVYAFTKIHVMNNLIIIEVTTVTIIMMMFLAMGNLKMENHIILYFIIMVICESMIGLSLMIAMIRTHSNDFIKSLSILQF